MALTKAKVGTKVQSKAKQSPGFSVLWFFKAKQSPAGENPKFFKVGSAPRRLQACMLLLLLLLHHGLAIKNAVSPSLAEQHAL